MGRVRLILISLAALVVALGAAFVARGIASPRAPKTTVIVAAPPAHPTVNVLVAKRDLQVGDRLDAAMMHWQPWPAETTNPAFVTDGAAAATASEGAAKAMAAAGGAAMAAKAAVTGDVGRMAAYVGAVVRQPIGAGEPITDKKIVRAGVSGVMAVTLQPGMRAMSIPLSAENAAGGFILPGDHVDVVQVQKPQNGSVQAYTVMRNIRVLAIDQASKALSGASTQLGSQATIELSPDQAQDMVLARAQGELTLVLRSYADAAGSASTGEMRRTVAETPTVRVFRTGQETEVKVSR